MTSRTRKTSTLSLRWRLVSISVAALLPTIGVLLLNEAALRRSRAQEVNELALRSARLANSELTRIIEGVHSVLFTAATLPDVQRFAPTCPIYLGAIETELDQLVSLHAVDMAGELRCSGPQDAAATVLKSKSWYRELVQTEGPAVGRYTAGPGLPKPLLPVAWPLRDGAGQRVGTLIAGIDLVWLGGRLKERGLSRGGALTIADQDGIIITRDPMPDRFVGTRIPDPFLRLVRGTDAGTEPVMSQDGTQRVIGFVPAKASGISLYISAGLSQDESFSAIDRATLYSLLSILLAGVLSLAIAWWTGERYIRRPVGVLLGRIRAWSRGEETSADGFSAGSTEVAELSEAFDRMIGEINRREQDRTLLLNELEHRIKNTTSMIQSIAHQTLRGEVPPASMAAFNARLVNLSRAHEALTRSSWTSADLRDLVLSTVGLQPSGRRVSLDGPTVELPPKAVLGLALVLHELMTNATKYGALSDDQGRVDVRWTVAPREEDGQTLELVWDEREGPPVAQPSRKGFGTTVIGRALSGELEGKTTIDYRPSGLLCRIQIRLPAPVPAAAPATTFAH
ncbi:sensor histidine kinase [uncultured Alsobacter sp.]|uniref:sensor histidine kinase n=1 Tax=uncultured Alsobacter sp. TaxID=1748258 RepID=UPI0025EED506|nr:sensor histidine kinase [uncultured Alsobacter sp.]